MLLCTPASLIVPPCHQPPEARPVLAQLVFGPLSAARRFDGADVHARAVGWIAFINNGAAWRKSVPGAEIRQALAKA